MHGLLGWLLNDLMNMTKLSALDRGAATFNTTEAFRRAFRIQGIGPGRREDHTRTRRIGAFASDDVRVPLARIEPLATLRLA